MQDSFGRKINYLRFSITDRCDLRCKYCMPQNMTFSDKSDILGLNDLEFLSKVLIQVGIKKIRITGGEPLVRKDIIPFLKNLNKYKKEGSLDEITITSNGTLLEKYAKDLFNNGIKRMNISIDSLIPEKYAFITSGGKLEKVLNGIKLAKKLGISIKINTVLIKNFNEDEIISLTKWCAEEEIKLFNDLAPKNLKYQLIELCLDILSADGVADSKELIMLRELTEKLELNFDEVQNMKDKAILNLDLSKNSQLQSDTDQDEIDVGMKENLTKKEALDFIKNEFKKWNGRLNSLKDSSQREHAQKMLDALARLRKKYEDR